MLTVYDFNRVTFAHHRGIVPPMPAQEGKKAVEKLSRKMVKNIKNTMVLHPTKHLR